MSNNNLTLAITTIGDLLINNKITQDQDGNPIEEIHLKIPDYQRPYKWTSRNVIQLLDDIIEAKNDKKEIYRVGTLILHKCEKKNKETEEIEIIHDIVDGQQRMITFSLLLKSLLGKDQGEPKEKDETKDENGKINFLNQKLSDNPFNRRNIPNNYRTLERRVNKMGNDRGELFDYIKNHCELIVVITEDISEAFQFFDSQNARGKKLYPHDLLKAYHLREMKDLDEAQTEKVVRTWEDSDQKELSSLFTDYLYRVKEWLNGNKSWELNEQNIYKFKGITRQDNFPYAMYYKGAFAYAHSVNHSTLPFVSGMQKLKPFQLDTPIVAGKPFFDYASHYFELLKDIQDNNKYEGKYMNDNAIIRTLNLPKYKNGTGNQITRLLLDTALLLYIDRFCPDPPEKSDLEMLDQFVILAFIWAYSLRVQYKRLGWPTAQNYIMGNDKINSFNIYKIITDSDSPTSLLSVLSDRMHLIPENQVQEKDANDTIEKWNSLPKEGNESDASQADESYFDHFKNYKYYGGENERKDSAS